MVEQVARFGLVLDQALDDLDDQQLHVAAVTQSLMISLSHCSRHQRRCGWREANRLTRLLRAFYVRP